MLQEAERLQRCANAKGHAAVTGAGAVDGATGAAGVALADKPSSSCKVSKLCSWRMLWRILWSMRCRYVGVLWG